MKNLYATAAKGLAVTTATVTSLLVLLDPDSSAHRVAAEHVIVRAVNIVVLLIALVGWADIIWHDIRGRLIWPTLNPHVRHHICVLVYAALAGSYGLRLFSWAEVLDPDNVILALYYTLNALFIGSIAVAIALETRNVEQV